MILPHFYPLPFLFPSLPDLLTTLSNFQFFAMLSKFLNRMYHLPFLYFRVTSLVNNIRLLESLRSLLLVHLLSTHINNLFPSVFISYSSQTPAVMLLNTGDILPLISFSVKKYLIVYFFPGILIS